MAAMVPLGGVLMHTAVVKTREVASSKRRNDDDGGQELELFGYYRRGFTSREEEEAKMGAG